MLRLLSFLFLATWWIGALLAGSAKLPPPAVLAVTMTEASAARCSCISAPPWPG